MKTLELFAGTKSFSTVASSRGHATFTSDYDPSFGTDYTVDIMTFDTSRIPYRPDILWASPPCESFSVASIGHHWNLDNTPKTDEAEQGMRQVLKTIEIIKELKPTYWFIENPRGKLRKLPFMQDFHRYTVTYCQYGDTRMKPTDIWSNVPDLMMRPVCKNGMDCHVSAPRGSRTGTQGIATYKDRSRIPAALFESLISQLEARHGKPVSFATKPAQTTFSFML